MAGIPGALNAAGTGQEDNFYPYEETPVKYLFVTEKYLPATGREKFVNVARCTMHVSRREPFGIYFSLEIKLKIKIILLFLTDKTGLLQC